MVETWTQITSEDAMDEIASQVPPTVIAPAVTGQQEEPEGGTWVHLDLCFPLVRMRKRLIRGLR